MVERKGHSGIKQQTQKANKRSAIKGSDDYTLMFKLWGTNGEFEVLVHEGRYDIGMYHKLVLIVLTIGIYYQKNII